MCTAFSSRQSLVSQSWRTSSSSGRSLRSRRAFSSFGVISLMGLHHRRGPRYGPPHPPALVAPRVNRGAPRSRAVDTGPRYGPPHPPALVAPRVNRGAPRSRAVDTGPRYGPPHPPALVAPRVNRGAPRARAVDTGPRYGPPHPPALVAPRVNRGAPRSRAVDTGPRYGPPDCPSEGGYAPLGLPRPTLGRAPAEPWRASGFAQARSFHHRSREPRGQRRRQRRRAPRPARRRDLIAQFLQIRLRIHVEPARQQTHAQPEGARPRERGLEHAIRAPRHVGEERRARRAQPH